MSSNHSKHNSSFSRAKRRTVVTATVGALLSLITVACSDSTPTPTDAVDATSNGAPNTPNTPGDSTPKTGPGIVITPRNVSIHVGATATLTVQQVNANGVPTPAPGNPTFTSRNSSVASVNSAGQVLGVAPGTTLVIATWGAFKDSVNVFVSGGADTTGGSGSSQNAIAGIAFFPANYALQVGAKIGANVYAVDANGVPTLALLSGKPKFTMGNIQVATVDAFGIVTAVGPGTTTLQADWGTYKATASVAVYTPVDTAGRH
jgi:trimeric autotransporter adhesin